MATLVVGGTGEVGAAVVRELVARDMPFYATYAATSPPARLKARFFALAFDGLTTSAFKEILEKHGINVVVNCAVVPHGANEEHSKVLKGIVDSTTLIAEACQETHAVLVQFSTDLVFDGEAGGYVEFSEAKPKMYYGEVKLIMEQRLKEMKDLRCLIVRTSLVLTLEPELTRLMTDNPRRSKALLFCMKRIKEFTDQGKPTDFFDDEMRSMTFSHDLASAIVSIVSLPPQKLNQLLEDAEKLIHFTAPTNISRYDLAKALVEYYAGQIPNENKVEIVPGSSELIFKGARPLDCSFCTTKYQDLAQKYSLPALRPVLDVLKEEIINRRKGQS